MLAQINVPSDYNWWYILAYAGIDPTKDIDKYDYDEENEELIADISQEKLEQALAQYDHQAWLEELEQINNPKSEVDILKEKIAQQDQIIEDLMFTIIPEILGGGI